MKLYVETVSQLLARTLFLSLTNFDIYLSLFVLYHLVNFLNISNLESKLFIYCCAFTIQFTFVNRNYGVHLSFTSQV